MRRLIHSPPPKRSSAQLSRLKTAALSLLASIPLLDCVSVNRATKQTSVSSDGLCSVNLRGARVTFSYPAPSRPAQLNLELPEGVILSDVIGVICQKHRTVIITPKYVVRSLGYLDVAEGREMLGQFPDSPFYPQNTIAIDLSPIGNVVSASGHENILSVTTSSGARYNIDLDRPSQPAQPVETPINIY